MIKEEASEEFEDIAAKEFKDVADEEDPHDNVSVKEDAVVAAKKNMAEEEAVVAMATEEDKGSDTASDSESDKRWKEDHLLPTGSFEY